MANGPGIERAVSATLAQLKAAKVALT